jgi:Arc/MetJ-type ribon-helix-helix transcriptional regulator
MYYVLTKSPNAPTRTWHGPGHKVENFVFTSCRDIDKLVSRKSFGSRSEAAEYARRKDIAVFTIVKLVRHDGLIGSSGDLDSRETSSQRYRVSSDDWTSDEIGDRNAADNTLLSLAHQGKTVKITTHYWEAVELNEEKLVVPTEGNQSKLDPVKASLVECSSQDDGASCIIRTTEGFAHLGKVSYRTTSGVYWYDEWSCVSDPSLASRYSSLEIATSEASTYPKQISVTGISYFREST